ncbi:efflux RND transporter periplasmic adaptor subunit [Ethanoligenens harbinense]|uniref:Efflux transporter, RND family, MFP subunit n=1 Tax=Ethanoligenens harbinense (strain DSM 18485 / JCM 12961 / CGMCC 1.5033 / YUAN-3) TaxID=663278 RepID=E6U6X7_ETHHY|nr:efflux RND transporter periplasmic adaptor subunit [Ethanoligenens harbinense]ADU26944.1 efflux transporter, RND family, MFP subunit [Ethanoligenens harbinense YUAN-3]
MLLLSATTAVIAWIFVFPTVSAKTWSGENVMLAQVHMGTYQTQVQCSGTIQPTAEQAVSFGLPIKPTAIRVAVGDTVHAGQVLMDIDRDQSIAAFASAQSAQNQNDNAASNSSNSGDTAGTSSDDAAERLRQAISDWMPGTAQSASGNSESMNALLQQYQQYTGAGTAAQLQSALSSQLSQSTSGSGAAESALEQQIPSQITAPISGVITEINAAVGSFSAPATSLVVISDLSGLNLRAQVGQADISQVHTGQNVQISASAAGSGAGGRYTGTVTQVFPAAHSVSDASGTRNVVDVLIRVAKPDKNLLPDMSAQASITTNVNPKTLSVPYEAVQQDDAGQEYVFVLRGHWVYRQNIRTGAEFPSTVQVLSGLQGGDKVVLAPSSSLRSGTPVSVQGVRHV